MNEQTALGQWKNAPLAYVVAEIQYQRPLDLDAGLERFAASLAETFPIQEVGTIESTAVDANGKQSTFAEPLRELRDFANTTGIRISATSLALHTVDYKNWPMLKKLLLSSVDALEASISPRVQLRAGLRYIDLVVPREHESPDVYLDSGLASWSPSGATLGELEQSNLAIRFRDNSFTSKLILYSRVTAPMVLPPNFLAMPLTLSDIQRRAFECTQVRRQAIGVLDFDAGQEGPRPFNCSALMEAFETLHLRQSWLFKAAISGHARKEWGEA